MIMLDQYINNLLTQEFFNWVFYWLGEKGLFTGWSFLKYLLQFTFVQMHLDNIITHC